MGLHVSVSCKPKFLLENPYVAIESAVDQMIEEAAMIVAVGFGMAEQAGMVAVVVVAVLVVVVEMAVDVENVGIGGPEAHSL